jgi:hypothetical protein
MAAHRKSDRRRDNLCAGGLRKRVVSQLSASGLAAAMVRLLIVADDGELEAAHGACTQYDARSHAGLPSMIVIPVGDRVLIALVSLKPAAL